ncbi:alpha,alpha-trehalose-phosphate synthase (UDP-forming) [Pseudoroseomonas wenyumeiae]|uniref:Trehalose-6-phosphate synthase n=1 Tax=Teichococcus wenyumeiae TaxID=2478470 RepID=A0A3A9JP51_9PROT|nr:alpha,alpha-trehalose-phosphate synthase (UDP-forming) [Pseudoroseomonas wenyumeiae]RKK05604.1 alpha,alpha-trehalose-phosphate synthase (UDP-forming) [Pseudoroseomonas wenyumeiae]RMI19990.1 alpha,alpha-trehalose-phosphate synthase (UDP-forming) [Pseudoroseomonas wenyumeiae]
MSRLIVVSNRVAPITEGEPTAGGLAAGVMDALRQKGGRWFGWSGQVVPDMVTPPLPVVEQRSGSISLYTTDLNQRDYDTYYRGFANGTLWPIFHYQTELARFDWADFEGYRRVNGRFAEAISAFMTPEDVVWVHDYHLLCLAKALRQRGARNRIGLFLHTPFPAPAVMMNVPAHAELLAAMCQYDLIGFQTESDRLAFADYVLREMGGEARADGVLAVGGRAIRTGVYPIGVHVDMLRAEAEAAADSPQMQALRASLNGRALVMSVDRLDYSKGLPQRFAAYERFLAENAGWHRQVEFAQIAVPSRSDVQAYQEIRRQLEGEAGRINGRFAELDWTPLRYLNRSFARRDLMPLYAAAAVGLVTPLRDGMNLVAKEFVAAQDPVDPGVLILSRFAGAARELDAALLVNPHDEQAMAAALAQALAMPLQERRERHAAMMAVMRRNSLERWRDRFENDLRTPAALESVA